MALLKILQYPDERLHTVAAPVLEINDEIRTLVREMAETMYAAPGIGLAATQVDVHKRVIVMDLSDTRDELRVFIDPVIVSADGKPYELDAEGLLAVCIQHEMDHLLGKVFVDYLSPLKRARLTGKLRKKQ